TSQLLKLICLQRCWKSFGQLSCSYPYGRISYGCHAFSQYALVYDGTYHDQQQSNQHGGHNGIRNQATNLSHVFSVAPNCQNTPVMQLPYAHQGFNLNAMSEQIQLNRTGIILNPFSGWEWIKITCQFVAV